MSRPRKKAAEKLELLLKQAAKLQADIEDAKKLAAMENEGDANERSMILGRACLAYFADPTAVKNSRTIENLLLLKMTASQRKWYEEHPHGLIKEAPPVVPPATAPSTAPVAKDQPVSSSRDSDTSVGQSTDQRAEDHA